jgi:predicted nucleotidyltransferase
MNKNTTDILISELKEGLNSRYKDFTGIYFFGSRSRENFSDESDLDLVLTFERNIDRDFKNEVRDFVYDYALKYNVVIDSHIYNLNEILNPITPFRYVVRNEGIFYGK